MLWFTFGQLFIYTFGSLYLSLSLCSFKIWFFFLFSPFYSLFTYCALSVDNHFICFMVTFFFSGMFSLYNIMLYGLFLCVFFLITVCSNSRANFPVYLCYPGLGRGLFLCYLARMYCSFKKPIPQLRDIWVISSF